MGCKPGSRQSPFTAPIIGYSSTGKMVNKHVKKNSHRTIRGIRVLMFTWGRLKHQYSII